MRKNLLGGRYCQKVPSELHFGEGTRTARQIHRCFGAECSGVVRTSCLLKALHSLFRRVWFSSPYARLQLDLCDRPNSQLVPLLPWWGGGQRWSVCDGCHCETWPSWCGPSAPWKSGQVSSLRTTKWRGAIWNFKDLLVEIQFQVKIQIV